MKIDEVVKRECTINRVRKNERGFIKNKAVLKDGSGMGTEDKTQRFKKEKIKENIERGKMQMYKKGNKIEI